jgi:hypothetical protein
VRCDARAVRNCDAGAFLSAVLQCEKAEESKAGNIKSVSEDTEYCAFFSQALHEKEKEIKKGMGIPSL